MASIDVCLDEISTNFDAVISELRNDAKECDKLGINHKFLQLRANAQKLRSEFYELKQKYKKLNDAIIYQCVEVQKTKLKY